MRYFFTPFIATALLAGAGPSAQAALSLPGTTAAVASADNPTGATAAQGTGLLSETASADATGMTSDLRSEAHLDLKVGRVAASASHQPAILADGNDNASFANSAPSGQLAGLPHVPEPSSETALYVLGGAVGLGLVVMRRRRLA